MIVNSPKHNQSRHKPQLSQPTIQNYQNLNSFNEYFKSQKKKDSSVGSKRPTIFEIRCRTDASIPEGTLNTKKHSNNSTTMTNGSISPKHRFTKITNISFKSNSSNSKKDLKSKNSVAPFQEEDRPELQIIIKKTQKILEAYQQREEQYKKNEQQMRSEIIKLRLEMQQRKTRKY